MSSVSSVRPRASAWPPPSGSSLRTRCWWAPTISPWRFSRTPILRSPFPFIRSCSSSNGIHLLERTEPRRACGAGGLRVRVRDAAVEDTRSDRVDRGTCRGLLRDRLHLGSRHLETCRATDGPYGCHQEGATPRPIVVPRGKLCNKKMEEHAPPPLRINLGPPRQRLGRDVRAETARFGPTSHTQMSSEC